MNSLSQHSSYSGLSDIDELILAAPIGTQLERLVNRRASGAQDSEITEPPASAKPLESSSDTTTGTTPISSTLLNNRGANTSIPAGRMDRNVSTVLQNNAFASVTNIIPRTDSNNSTTSSTSSASAQTSGRDTPASRKRIFGDISDSPSSAGPCRPFKLARWAGTDNDDGAFPPVIISHSPPHQRIFNKLNLPYGVQYEIARLAANSPGNQDGFEKLTQAGLEKLQGLSNADAVPRIPELFGETLKTVAEARLSTKEKEAKAPWVELDLEEKYLKEDPFAGLGFQNESSDWFGGKVHFVGKLIASKDRECPFKVVLKPPELGPSDRFARRWGSDRFLTLSLSKDVLKKGAKVIEFLHRPLILCDRVFRAFDAKDGNVFLVCTNEIVEGRKIHATRTSPGLLSFRDFLAWHNALELNPNQTMAKWASRFALGRSNSAPVLRLEQDAIKDLEDISGFRVC